MTISAITFLSGLATASGNPIGLAVALGLNLLKTVFTIGKRASQKPGETESEKLEKVIKEALNEYRETSLKAEWNGYERSSDIFSENVKFLSRFDKEINDFKDEIEKLALEKTDIKRSVFDIVVSKFYTELMSSTVLSGKIQHEITEQCDEDVEKFKVLLKKKKENPTISKEEDKEDYAKKCLGLYELYGKMNYYRQTRFLNDLNTISNVIDNRTEFSVDSTIDNKSVSALKLKAFSFKLLILNVIKQVNENDKKVYKPLADAFKNVKMRFLINYYHTHSKKYEYLNKYMEKLDLEQDRLKQVMFCTKEALTGSCTLKVTNDNQFKYRSAFVPKDKTLEIIYKKNKKGKKDDKKSNQGSLKIFGPGTMPNMFYNIGDDKKTNPVKSHTIGEYKRNATVSRFVKICRFPKQRKKDDPLEPLHKAVCTDREFSLVDLENKDGVSVSTDDLHCGSNKCFGGTPIAISTEEIDVAFTAHKKIEKKGDYTWGPFFGPIPMGKGCGSIFWDELRFYRYKSSKLPEAEQKAFNQSFLPTFNIENNLELSNNKGITDKSYFLKICKEKSLKGFCQEIPLVKGQANNNVINLKHVGIGFEPDKTKGKTKGSIIEKLKKIFRETSKGKESWKEHTKNNDECIWNEGEEFHLTSPNEKINLLRSMKVPNGMTVELYNEYNATGDVFGPYEGPLTVDRVDGNGAFADKTIKSINIIENNQNTMP